MSPCRIKNQSCREKRLERVLYTYTYMLDSVQFDGHKQVGEMKANKIQLHCISRIRILIRLCSLPIHSPCICMLRPTE